MAHTYEELHKKTVAELRDIAKDIDHEAVEGYTQLNKEHLLPAICDALGIKIEKHHRHEPTGIDKGQVKEQLKQLRADRQKALEAGDRAELKAIRRKYHRLNHRIRAATVA